MRLPLLLGMGRVTCLLILGVGPDMRLNPAAGDSSGCASSSKKRAPGQQRQLGPRPVRAARGCPATILKLPSLCNSISQTSVCGVVQTRLAPFLCQPP